MTRILLGTSSWSEKGWVGPFYPDGCPPAAFLSHYATRFPVVEADVTYYRVPSLRMVQGWRAKTPPGFQIAAKFPRSIVHAGQGPRPDPERLLVPRHVERERDAFLEAMQVLGDRQGPLVLQFPYFNRQAFAEVGPFLERLDAFLEVLPKGGRYAVELRNKGWLDEALLSVLRSHGVTLVHADMPWMPHPLDLLDRLDPVTSDLLYIRLIGDRKVTDALTSTFHEVVVDRSAQLDRWADWIAMANSRATEVVAFANNHFAGHGPATAKALQARLEARGLECSGPPTGPLEGELPLGGEA